MLPNSLDTKLNQAERYKIKTGRKVAVYNDDFTHKRRSQLRPQKYTILGYSRGGYDVMDEQGKVSNISRYRLKLLPEY